MKPFESTISNQSRNELIEYLLEKFSELSIARKNEENTNFEKWTTKTCWIDLEQINHKTWNIFFGNKSPRFSDSIFIIEWLKERNYDIN